MTGSQRSAEAACCSEVRAGCHARQGIQDPPESEEYELELSSEAQIQHNVSSVIKVRIPGEHENTK